MALRCVLKGIRRDAGNAIYLVGAIVPTRNGELPAADLYRGVHRAMQLGLVRACHDLSEGGLAVAAAEMCIGGRLGLALNISAGNLFVETNGCLLVEVGADGAEQFEYVLAGLPLHALGRVTASNRLEIASAGVELLSLPIDELVAAWNTRI
jgi:phosphoribosylformylglycinamidine synthase